MKISIAEKYALKKGLVRVKKRGKGSHMIYRVKGKSKGVRGITIPRSNKDIGIKLQKKIIREVDKLVDKLK